MRDQTNPEVVELLQIGQKKSMKSKFFWFFKLVKHPQTKFHAHAMKDSQVIRSKKSKFIVLLARTFLAA